MRKTASFMGCCLPDYAGFSLSLFLTELKQFQWQRQLHRCVILMETSPTRKLLMLPIISPGSSRWSFDNASFLIDPAAFQLNQSDRQVQSLPPRRQVLPLEQLCYPTLKTSLSVTLQPSASGLYMWYRPTPLKRECPCITSHQAQKKIEENTLPNHRQEHSIQNR